ncbi:hypothetical protein ERUR111494_02565 [Erysipelothrix urinaevulpis]|uniref:hypothetical protein n=1 Tax=Erysipelothrix urinaevulpis TaxID=2683717 RepID=UPI00135AAC10|nr:hypothetical protein [Erysipelothrix urinaevulpis]
MRKEVYELLSQITNNVFQEYPNKDKDFPCLVFTLNNTAGYSMSDIEYYKQFLRVEIFAETAEQRSELEVQVIEKLFKDDWINKNNRDIPHELYYRQDLTFERKD